MLSSAHLVYEGSDWLQFYHFLWIVCFRYSIIAFLRPVSGPEIGPQVCRHILRFAGVKDCEIGKSKVVS